MDYPCAMAQAGALKRARGRRPRAEIAISFRSRGVRVAPGRLRRLIQFVAAAQKRHLKAVDLTVVGQTRMRRLNRRYLGRDRATDVLCFDLSGPAGAGVEVQVVVCSDEARRQARLLGQSPADELMLYVVHGLLHAMGHDDRAPASARRMHAREASLLETFRAPAHARRAARRG